MDKTISLDKKQVVPLAMQIFNVIAAQVAGAGYTHFIIIKNGGSIEADEMSLMGASI